MYSKKHINNKDESQNLKDLAPNLSEINRKNPFIVPDDYFDKLPSIIQQRCNEKTGKTSWTKKINFILRPQYYVSISLAVIVIAFILISKHNSNTQKILIASNNIEYYTRFLTDEDILEIGDFDEEILTETLVNETNSNEEISYISENTDYKNISADDIINYLSEEDNNNIDDIINEF